MSYFVHGLNDMMDAERQLVEALQELAGDSSRSALQKAFEQHRRETEGQIERLEQCFELLGERPEDTECHGIRGLVAEKKAFLEEDPSEDLVDVFNVGAAIKAENYEICEYESLIDMAREVKHTKVAQLLSQNLKEEKATLKKMEGFSEKVKPNEMMNDEQRQKAHLQANKQLHNPRAPFCTQQGSFGSTQFRRLLLLLLAHRA
jgi:ferritin-like metal-binding protein YciE